MLGFGCSALVGGNTTAESMRLLETAFDAGIRHFDVARVYGTGDAERLLGRFADGRRNELVIATKFGIRPLPPSASVNVAKRVLRPVLRRSKPLLGLARRHAARAVLQPPRFGRDEALESLATSLGALATDRIDIFLLHECEAADWDDPALQEALAEQRSVGRIVAYGTATSREQTGAVLKNGRWQPDVIQFESDARADRIDPLGRAGVPRRIVHSCLKNVLPLLRDRVTARPDVASAWSAELGVDARSLEELAALALSSELHRNAGGVVLFSSNRPSRISTYADAVRERRFAPEQCGAFAGRVRQLGPTAVV